MPTALVTGIGGQDGAYLADLLLKKGYRVLGAERRSSRPANARLHALGIAERVEMIDFDLVEQSSIIRMIRNYKPDEVYNLAAQSFVSSSFEQPIYTANVDALGVVRLLDALRTFSPESRFYQASTSEMFGKVRETPQTESTPFHPRSPYGVAKLYGHWITVNYRESYGMHTSSGILFNHESPLRGREFVTRKISTGLARIKAGSAPVLELGNLGSKRDWGFAGDYVEGMWLMLQASGGDDFVLATGETHSIREFATLAGAALGMDLIFEGEDESEVGVNRSDGEVVIRVNPKFFRPAEVDLLLGSGEKARERLGWRPKVQFGELVEMMAKADYDLAKSGGSFYY